MIKTLFLYTAVFVGTSTFAFAGPIVQMGRSAAMDHQPKSAHRNRVTATGRCNGISYGTGQRSCGTATGGTPGGNPSRN